MTATPIKQALTVPPAQMNRIVEAGMKAVYGMNVEVSEVKPKDHNMMAIGFTMIEKPSRFSHDPSNEKS